MDSASFRPPLRRLGARLLLGAAAGAALGLAAGVPLPLGVVFGAAAAGLALGAIHATGQRVVADARGVRVMGHAAHGAAGGAGRLEAAWGEVRLGFGLTQREDGRVQRFAVLGDARGRAFAFTDAGEGGACATVTGADGRPLEVAELTGAPLLLALVVQRAPAWHVFPEELRDPPASPAAPAPEAAPERAPVERAPGRRPAAGRPGLGLWAALAKIGVKLLGSAGKVGGGALKAAKAANVGWAAFSMATYAILFSWPFALALMLQLFVHEYGHVFAMRRTGMRVRGIYFLPMGALAVSEDAYRSRRQQVVVALSGPLWGSLLILAPLALWWWTGQPLWAAIASWWALLNLFNLLPIAPLDGGRVLQAFALSFSSGLGLAATALGLAGAVALATAVGFSVVWFVAALGAMELLGEAQARQGGRALRLLPEPSRLGTPHWLFLRAALGPGGGHPDDGAFLRQLQRGEQAARAEPLRPGQLLAYGIAYAALAAALVLVVYLLREVPGAAAASGLLE